MLIPHLHFCDNCNEAIALYEKAFNTKATDIQRNCDYDPEVYAGDTRISHAVMKIHGQIVFLNDRSEFANTNKSPNGATHLIVQFQTTDELLTCYEILKDGSTMIDPFEKTSYSELTGNFMDKFGVMWGFMVG